MNKPSRYLFVLILFIHVSFAADTQLAPLKQINLIAPRAVDNVYRLTLESIYTEAFKRLGISVSFSGCVPHKCGQYVTKGAADGEMARATIYESKYPELLRTKESLFSVNASAFSTNPSVKLNSWDDLIGKKYKIAYIRYPYFEKKITERVDPQNIVHVTHWDEGLSALLNKKVDIYIGIERTTLEALKGKSSPIHNLGIIDTQYLYPYFNKKHKLLSENLGAVLKEMKLDGTMNKLLLNNLGPDY